MDTESPIRPWTLKYIFHLSAFAAVGILCIFTVDGLINHFDDPREHLTAAFALMLPQLIGAVFFIHAPSISKNILVYDRFEIWMYSSYWNMLVFTVLCGIVAQPIPIAIYYWASSDSWGSATFLISIFVIGLSHTIGYLASRYLLSKYIT